MTTRSGCVSKQSPHSTRVALLVYACYYSVPQIARSTGDTQDTHPGRRRPSNVPEVDGRMPSRLGYCRLLSATVGECSGLLSATTQTHTIPQRTSQ